MKLKIKQDVILDGISASMSFEQTNLCPLAKIVLSERDFFTVYEKNQNVFYGKEEVILMYDYQPICVGFIDSFHYEGERVSVVMRNKASLLVDSHLDLPYQQKKMARALDLIQEIAGMFGIAVEDYTKSFKAAMIKNFSYERGQTAFEVIDQIAHSQDVTVSSNALGHLVLDPRDQLPLPIILDGISALTYTQRNDGVYGKIKIFCSKEDDQGAVSEENAVETEPEGHLQKVWIKNIAEQGDGVVAKKVAEREKRIRRLNRENFLVTTNSITQSGQLLKMGQRVIVPFNHTSYQLKIKSIKLHWDTGKEKAIYSLSGSLSDQLQMQKDDRVMRTLSGQGGVFS